MFRRMQNATKYGTARVLECVRRRLPPGWSATDRAGHRERAVTFRGPDRRQTSFAIVARKAMMPRDVRVLASEGREATLVVAPYLGERTRELLAEAGISFADATGNLRIVASSPAIFLEGVGAEHDPERQVRPLHSLRGAAAGRVVRALCEFAPPFGVRTLAEISATPLGTVSRVVSLLETEALLARDEKKQVISVDWAALLKRWASDYGVGTSNVMRAHLEPRGLGALWPKLAKLPRYAATSSVAGTGIAPARLAMIYVDDAEAAAETLELVETEAGANVWLLQPFDDVVFERSRERILTAGDSQAMITIVSPAQAVVDLMSSPGRGPQEAAALLDTMKTTVAEWQRGARS
jgi:hypothetical protein